MRRTSAMQAAQKIQRKVARHGFEWPSLQAVLRKVREEIRETVRAIKMGDRSGVREEIGDLLFTVIGLAEKSGMNAEKVLRGANRKFMRRFRKLERELRKRGKQFPQDLKLLDALWRHVKK